MQPSEQGGVVTTDFNNGDDLGSDVAIQADGKIIVVGRAKDSSNFFAIDLFELVRYNSNGSLDPTFGSGGRAATFLSTDGAAADSVAIQSDGRIVVAGRAGLYPTSGRLVRYNSAAFNICLQDDSNGNILKINSTTGDYLFMTCSGVTLGGRGTLIRKGTTMTLQDYASDRRVLMTYDSGVRRGTASIRILSSGRSFSIMDRDTANNTCGCP